MLDTTTLPEALESSLKWIDSVATDDVIQASVKANQYTLFDLIKSFDVDESKGIFGLFGTSIL